MKDLIRKLYESEIVRYAFFGGLTTLVNLAVFYGLLLLKINHNAANVVSIIVAILFAYIVNFKYVFRSKCDSLKEHLTPFLRFVGARLFSMVVEVGGVWLLVDVLSQNPMVGKLLTQAIVIVLNYIFSKFFVFKTEKNNRKKDGKRK